MKKRIIIEVEGACKSCPFCQYEPWYILGGESGYDCKYPGSKVGRVVGDGEIRAKYSSKTNSWPSIPGNCPLDDIEEKDEQSEKKD